MPSTTEQPQFVADVVQCGEHVACLAHLGGVTITQYPNLADYRNRIDNKFAVAFLDGAHLATEFVLSLFKQVWIV